MFLRKNVKNLILQSSVIWVKKIDNMIKSVTVSFFLELRKVGTSLQYLRGPVFVGTTL